MSDEALIPTDPNPYASPAQLLAEKETTPALFQGTPSGRPRVWTVFVAFLAAFGGTIAFSVVGAVIVVLWYFAAGGAPGDLPRELPAFVTQPPQFILLAAFSQLAILLAAIVPAWFSPQPLKLRLGMTIPRLPLWHWPVLVFGGVIPLAFGIFCAVAVSWGLLPMNRYLRSMNR